MRTAPRGGSACRLDLRKVRALTICGGAVVCAPPRARTYSHLCVCPSYWATCEERTCGLCGALIRRVRFVLLPHLAVTVGMWGSFEPQAERVGQKVEKNCYVSVYSTERRSRRAARCNTSTKFVSENPSPTSELWGWGTSEARGWFRSRPSHSREPPPHQVWLPTCPTQRARHSESHVAALNLISQTDIGVVFKDVGLRV